MSPKRCARVPNAVTRQALKDVERGVLFRFAKLEDALESLGLKP